jgi:LPLT family lysophospholipid transporter-like MFS transporter
VSPEQVRRVKSIGIMNGQVVQVAARRNYLLLLAGQFLSAFADNFILMVILGPLLTDLKNGKITSMQQSIINIFYTSLLLVPYVLFAPLSGYLNDRFSKNRWLVGANLIKLLGAAVAAMSIDSGAVWLAAGYFIVGIGACLYSPAKYGILPEILPTARLVKANGMVEMLTLVAILTGNIGGAIAFDDLPLRTCYWITMAVYGFSMGLNLLMSRTPSYRNVKFADSAQAFFRNLADLCSQKRLVRVLGGTALFWVCAVVLKENFQPWGQQVLKLQSMTQISLLNLWLALGVMTGSVLAGQLYPVGDLHATRRNGWLLAGGIGVLGSLGWFLDAGLDYPKTLAIGILVVTGLMAGLFLIPLNAALQAESHKDSLGKTIATQNWFENFAMLGGSVIAYLNVKKGFNPSQLLLVLAVFVAVVNIWLKIPAKKIDEPIAVNTK